MSSQTASTPTALIVGAGPGMGAALARSFGRAGHDVALIARSEEALAGIGGELESEGITAGWAAADVAHPQSLASAIQRFGDYTGRIEVLLYNAVKFRPVRATELTADMLLDDLAVGVAGLLTAIDAVKPYMQRQGSGTILVTGGGAADRPMPSAGSLGVQKAAVRSLVQNLAPTLADEGIHVATITIRGTIAEGTPFAPEKIAPHFVELAAETSGPKEHWRTLVDYTGA